MTAKVKVSPDVQVAAILDLLGINSITEPEQYSMEPLDDGEYDLTVDVEPAALDAARVAYTADPAKVVADYQAKQPKSTEALLTAEIEKLKADVAKAKADTVALTAEVEKLKKP